MHMSRWKIVWNERCSTCRARRNADLDDRIVPNGRRGSMRMATPVRGADAWLCVATLLEFPHDAQTFVVSRGKDKSRVERSRVHERIGSMTVRQCEIRACLSRINAANFEHQSKIRHSDRTGRGGTHRSMIDYDNPLDVSLIEIPTGACTRYPRDILGLYLRHRAVRCAS